MRTSMSSQLQVSFRPKMLSINIVEQRDVQGREVFIIPVVINIARDAWLFGQPSFSHFAGLGFSSCVPLNSFPGAVSFMTWKRLYECQRDKESVLDDEDYRKRRVGGMGK